MAALLRATTIAALAALCLDAPAGRGALLKPYAALDVSASWGRADDSAAYRSAIKRLNTIGADSVFLIGDSLRVGRVPVVPEDRRSRVRPAVERALAAGRPLVVITDGELDDPDALAELPAGSRIEVIPHGATRDGALTLLDAPRAAVAGDTIDVRATVMAGQGGAPQGRVGFSFGSPAATPAASVVVEPLPAGGERTVSVRISVPAGEGPRAVRAVWSAVGDPEPHDDTLSVALDVSPAAGAVFISTAPDEDARYALAVLRGTLALPTRGFFRVAPGQWRADGSLAPVLESDVRRAVAAAPVVILHGDTAVFGPPRTAARGALALVSPPAPAPDEEWYATSGPPSPLAASLTGIPWDSLPPIDVAAAAPAAEWQGLEVKRGRRLDRRVAVVGGVSGGRRVIVVVASGLWRWRFRAGASSDAYAALWGGIFDWLAAERRDQRAAVPTDALVREGEAIRWRRGMAADSVVPLVVSRRGSEGPPDTIRLRFARGASTAESAPLVRGLYDVRVPGGTALLIVNASREWLPRVAIAQSGQIGGAVLAGAAPRLRSVGWIYILLVSALCAEWLIRRRSGLR